MKLLSVIPASAKIGSGSLISIGIEFLTMLYLMRQLGPDPFGLFAMAMSLLVLLRIMQDGGAGAYLVSKRGGDARTTSAAFIVALLFSLVLIFFAYFISPAITWFYEDSRIEDVWIALSFLIFFSAINTIPTSLAQREQRFFLYSWIPVLAHIAASTASIMVAQERQDVWPIVSYHVVLTVVSMLLFWLVVRPKLAWPTPDDLNKVLRFSKGLISYQLLSALNRNADNVLIGKFLGSQALGDYGVGYRMLTLPLRKIGGMVSTLAYPRLSGLSGDISAVIRGLSEVMREVALFSTPFCIGVAIVSEELILVTIGPEWAGARFPLLVFALLGIYQAPFSLMGLSYLITRKTSIMAKWGMISTPVIILSFIAGLPWGIDGVAVAYSTASLLLSVPMVRMASSVLSASPLDLIKGPLKGIGHGVIFSIPIVMVYFVVLKGGGDSLMVLIATIFAGSIVETMLYLRVMRIRREHGSLW